MGLLLHRGSRFCLVVAGVARPLIIVVEEPLFILGSTLVLACTQYIRSNERRHGPRSQDLQADKGDSPKFPLELE